MFIKLTKKQDAFVKEYLLNGGNATKAAVKAGYSEKTANEQGSQNLAKLSVKKAIELHQKEANKTFIWSKEQKLLKLEEIAKATMQADPEKGMINATAAIAAIKEHNLMMGDNAPLKSETRITTDDFESLMHSIDD